MKTISAKELKSRTGEVLRRVGRGDKILVTMRGKPCAVISPAREEHAAATELLPYKEAWRGIEQALRGTKARHRSWEDAIRWSRRRA